MKLLKHYKKIIGLLLIVGLIFILPPKTESAYQDSTTNSGTTTTPNVAVPAGVQANDIVILISTYDASAASYAGKYPTGFTALAEIAQGPDGGRASISWKRLTAADSGSYTFTAVNGVAQNWVTQAFAFRGRSTTSDPVLTATNNTASNTSPVTATVPAVTAVAGDDIFAFVVPDVNATGIFNAYTSRPATYTPDESQENGFANAAGDHLENVNAGSTGTKTYVFTLTSGASGWYAGHVRIPVAPASTQGGKLVIDKGSVILDKGRLSI